MDTPPAGPHERKVDLSAILKWTILLSFLSLIIAWHIFVVRHIVMGSDWMEELFRTHAGALIGLPICGLSAYFLVLFLEIRSGPIRVDARILRLEGASGPVVMWIVAFAVMALCGRMLW